MNVIRANILSDAILHQADAICTTTNGVVKSNGQAVMGAGNAKAFAERWPQLPAILGKCLNFSGNRVYRLCVEHLKAGHTTIRAFDILSFPTKNNWKDNSDLELILRSASELKSYTDLLRWEKVYLPPPGCGMGGLNWRDVQTAIEPILDDRFTVCFLR